MSKPMPEEPTEEMIVKAYIVPIPRDFINYDNFKSWISVVYKAMRAADQPDHSELVKVLENIRIGPYMQSMSAFGRGWEAARQLVNERIGIAADAFESASSPHYDDRVIIARNEPAATHDSIIQGGVDFIMGPRCEEGTVAIPGKTAEQALADQRTAATQAAESQGGADGQARPDADTSYTAPEVSPAPAAGQGETPRMDAAVKEWERLNPNVPLEADPVYKEGNKVERELAKMSAENSVLREQNFAMNKTIATLNAEAACAFAELAITGVISPTLEGGIAGLRARVDELNARLNALYCRKCGRKKT